jgi:HlyD family secretion protein
MNRARVSFLFFAAATATLIAAGCMRPGGGPEKKDANQFTVEKGAITVEVIESGPLEAVRTVEVKSRVSGRVDKLFVDEGDMVTQGQLIAVIDPQETELQVKQNRAQLQGAQAGIQRLDVEIAQRRVTAQTNLNRARNAAAQLKLELAAQPAITSSSIRTAESSLRSQEQALELLTTVTQPNARVQAQSAVTNAQAGVRAAEADYNRQKELYGLGYVAKRVLENAELSLANAKASLTTAQDRLTRIDEEQALERKQAEERVSQAKSEYARVRANTVQDDVKQKAYERALIDIRDAEVALKDIQAMQAGKRQQQAGVSQLQSALSDSMRLLGETEIRAPVSGIVTKRLVQLGELVASLSSFSSGSPIVKIEDRSTMLVKMQINEIDVAKLSMGTKAEVKVDALPNDKFSGQITKIAPAAIEATAGAGNPVVKYEVEVILQDISGKLKSGMTAKCTMKVVDVKDVIRVKTEFVGHEKDGSAYVLVITGDKPDPKTKKLPTKKTVVRVGEASGAYLQLLDGVKVGDKLLKPEFTGPPRATLMQFGPDDDEGGSGGDSSGESGGGSGGSGDEPGAQAN